jgi:hypothetical protein
MTDSESEDEAKRQIDSFASQLKTAIQKSEEDYFLPSYVDGSHAINKDEVFKGLKSTRISWQQRVTDFATLGMVDVLDVMSAIADHNAGEQSEFFLIAKIEFRSSVNAAQAVIGSMEFIHEHLGGVLHKKLSLITYRIRFGTQQHMLLEQVGSWEQGIPLTILTTKDFHRNPEKFIVERLQKA